MQGVFTNEQHRDAEAAPMDAMTLSLEATKERFDRVQERTERNLGYAQTAGGQGVVKEHLGALSSFFTAKLAALPSMDNNHPEKPFLRALSNLDHDVIALSALSSALFSIYHQQELIRTQMTLGKNIAAELWAAKLLADNSRLYGRIEQAAKLKTGSVRERRKVARRLATQAGWKTKDWTPKAHLIAGNWLLDCVLTALPEVFTLVTMADQSKMFTITEGASALIERCIEETMCRNPAWFPCTEPPKPWEGFKQGGFWDERMRLHAPLVRVRHKDSTAAVRNAMRDGSMQPHVDAVNALQSVAWSINTKVLEVIKWCYEHNVEVAGLPSQKDVPLPPRLSDEQWENEDARKVHVYKLGQTRQRNRALACNRVLFAADVATAERLATSGPFWTPFSCDWRGRVYALSHFNNQRDDRVRALFLFADGMPIGTDGLYWLKVHVANCGGFDKIDKRSFEERVAWTNTNLKKVIAVAEDPTSTSALAVWSKADKPFLFLAACFELAQAVSQGSAFITRLPVSFDGSCSGLQHLCAMTRAAEGSLVNLTPQELPQDVYQTVADLVHSRISAELTSATATEDQRSLARLCLDHGITRKLVKRNVMTYSYSSKKFGMAGQHVEDTMRPLELEVLEGKRDAHPFSSSLDVRKDGSRKAPGSAAATYLATHVYGAIETVVSLPAQAMTMLQKCAKALAHEGKPLRWTTPLGLPWVNRYHPANMKRVKLWLQDTPITISYADGDQPEIDKDKASNGVAPNLVHACDAAHLLLTVNACVTEGITNIATVHDSFGCLAPQATRFNQIIRETFVQMYEQHDVLVEVLESASCDLTLANRERLPTVPAYGPLNLKEVLNAKYAFA
jgi:DNA-directed RNA polymerase